MRSIVIPGPLGKIRVGDHSSNLRSGYSPRQLNPLLPVVGPFSTPVNSASQYSTRSEMNRLPTSSLSRVHDTFDMDPYGERADDIGLSHGIRGVGHLLDLLKPPGWLPGHPPVDPKIIRVLYLNDRDNARSRCPSDLDVNNPQHQRLQCEFENELKLHRLLMNERTSVYEQYQQRFGLNINQQDRSMLPPPGGRLATLSNQQSPAAHSFSDQFPTTPLEPGTGKFIPLEIFHLSL